MVRPLLLLLTALVALLNAAPAFALREDEGFIELSLPPGEVYQGEAVILQIQYIGPPKEEIDLTPIAAIGPLGRETFGTRLRMFNGELVELHTHRIEVTPQRVGLTSFGPLIYGPLTSNKLEVEVLAPQTAVWRPTEADIAFKQTLSNPNPWIQQQIVLDLELGYRHPLSDEKLELPEFAGFRVAPVLVQQRTHGRNAAGEPWATIAWRYLLYPQASGPKTLAGARFTGIISKSRTERAIVDFSGAATEIRVKPAVFPANQPWLVADSLALTEEWMGDPAQLAAGEEIERRLIVTAQGALAEQIPDVEMPRVPGLEVTRIGHKRVNRIHESGSEATAIFRYRIRAQRPGPAILDTIRLRWWNGAEGRAGEGVLPARRLEIGEPRARADSDAADPGLAPGAWREAHFLSGIGLQTRLGLGALLAGVLAALGWSLWRRRRAQGPASGLRAVLAAAESAVRRADPAGFEEALRALTRDPAAKAAAMGLRERFETAAMAGRPPDWSRLRTEFRTLRRALKTPAETDSLLPPL